MGYFASPRDELSNGLEAVGSRLIIIHGDDDPTDSKLPSAQKQAGGCLVRLSGREFSFHSPLVPPVNELVSSR